MNQSLIAIVEDNPDDEALTIRALKKHGISNKIAVLRDGVEALAFLLDPNQPLPQLVLLDLNLPRLNGLELLQRLRAEPRTRLLQSRADLKVLYTSGYADDTTAPRDIQGNRPGFMQKPYSPESLARHVRAVLHQAPGT